MATRTDTHPIKIRHIKDGRAKPWRVDGRKIGEGQRAFRTKAQAEGYRDTIWGDHEKKRADDLDWWTPANRALAVDAFKVLRDAGIGTDRLPAAAEVYVAALEAQAKEATLQRRTFKELREEFLVSQRGSGTTEQGLKAYKDWYGLVGQTLDDRMAHDITTTDIEKWMDGRGYKPKSRKQYRGALITLFNFGIKRNYLTENPAQGLEKVKKAALKRKPGILTPKQVRALLFAAKDYGAGVMLPFFAVGAFCGVRPEELRRLTWDAFDFDAKEINITEAKTGDDRSVDMPDCLIAWLALIPESARVGRLHYSRKAFDEIRDKAGVREAWDNSVLRHSAASHLFRVTDNYNKVTAQMGHGLETFKTHYKVAVKKPQAVAYFNVLPTDQRPGVVEMGERKSA